MVTKVGVPNRGAWISSDVFGLIDGVLDRSCGRKEAKLGIFDRDYAIIIWWEQATETA